MAHRARTAVPRSPPLYRRRPPAYLRDRSCSRRRRGADDRERLRADAAAQALRGADRRRAAVAGSGSPRHLRCLAARAGERRAALMKLRHYFEYGAVMTVRAMTRLLPMTAVLFLGTAMGRAFHLVGGSRRKLALQ